MPRRHNGATGGLVFHVLNRGVRRSNLFRTPGDYAAFLAVLKVAAARVAMRVLAYVLMPNHWHLVLWPYNDGDLERYVGWATLTHACRWHLVRETRGTGPVYQGRYKAIPVQSDAHLLTLIRYVERNAVRAGLAKRAEDWIWSSASVETDPDWPTLSPWPVPRPSGWADGLNEPDGRKALTQLRSCVSRSLPYGTDDWSRSTAEKLSWSISGRSVGRPRR